MIRPASEIPTHEEIGRTNSMGLGYGEMLRHAKQTALEFGGDGVVLLRFETTGWNTSLATRVIRWKP